MTQTPEASRQVATRSNKVPEVTVWFWAIKILCTTVGESLADYINNTVGIGLDATAGLFTIVLAAALTAQFRVRKYLPPVYWFAVVTVSVAGTLYTDILTDEQNVALRTSSAVFAVVLSLVFGLWYFKERTLSIHSIVTLPREGFYWLAVLVTFALGTATGDYTIELSGWTPGQAVLFPAALIAIIFLGWRAGANAVLAFWLAYILTRPLGANLGDYFASSPADGGLGLGTLVTSLVFLGAIAATVTYLVASRTDVTEVRRSGRSQLPLAAPARERLVLVGWVGAAVIGGLVLHHASTHKGTATLGEGPPAPAPTLAPGQSRAPLSATELTPFAVITDNTLALVEAGDSAKASARATDLESAWDDAQQRLQAQDPDGWDIIDQKIDPVLKSVRSKSPTLSTEKEALVTLRAALEG